MAARVDLPAAEIVDLSQVGPADLDPLMAEEIGEWRNRYAWDFRPSADLLRRFLQIKSLLGCALVTNGQVIGYSYYVCESKKGLIGDFYVRSQYADPEFELLLLGGMVSTIERQPGVRRIESQLMLFRPPPPSVPLPFVEQLSRHDRFFLQIQADQILRLPAAQPAFRVALVPFVERYMEDMAHVLAAAYRGHVDSDINDQYRTIPGARVFLNNIIKFPGCGRFSPAATMLAIDAASGKVCGMCLASNVAETSGHITQLCILPAIRGTKLGYELLRQTLMRLVENGCTSVSLTVTCSNVDAVRLYHSLGFQTEARFPALVWERR